jgi:hypothetical protein
VNALLAALFTALIASHSAPAMSADAQKAGDKAKKPKSAPREDPPGELFSKAQKALQERAARTAEVVKKNVANITRRVSGEPEAPTKKSEEKSARKEKKDRPEKDKKKDWKSP